MPEQITEEKIKMLVKFVDDNFKQRKTRDIFRFFMPAVFILIIVVFTFSLIIYDWTSISTFSWAPSLASIMAIVIACISFINSSVKNMNKQIAYKIAERLRLRLADKSDEAFHMLVPLVALKQENYHLKLSVLYEIDKGLFQPKKLAEYFYFK